MLVKSCLEEASKCGQEILRLPPHFLCLLKSSVGFLPKISLLGSLKEAAMSRLSKNNPFFPLVMAVESQEW